MRLTKNTYDRLLENISKTYISILRINNAVNHGAKYPNV